MGFSGFFFAKSERNRRSFTCSVPPGARSARSGCPKIQGRVEYPIHMMRSPAHNEQLGLLE